MMFEKLTRLRRGEWWIENVPIAIWCSKHGKRHTFPLRRLRGGDSGDARPCVSTRGSHKSTVLRSIKTYPLSLYFCIIIGAKLYWANGIKQKKINPNKSMEATRQTARPLSLTFPIRYANREWRVEGYAPRPISSLRADSRSRTNRSRGHDALQLRVHAPSDVMRQAIIFRIFS